MMPDPPDDDLYELTEADEAVEADGEVYELTEDDAVDGHDSTGAQTPSEVLDNDGRTYAVSQPTANPLRGDLKILEHPPRYCLACGHDLTLIRAGVCPGCEKLFNPQDPNTFSDEPIAEPGNWWAQPPRLAGYAVLPLWLIGWLIIAGATSAIGGPFSEVLVAFGVLVMLPWVAVCVLLGMASLDDYHNPKLIVTIPLGVVLGMVLTLGLHPALIFIAMIAGGFAGLLRAWRAM